MLRRAALPVDRLFRAFSDRTRLRILSLLASGEVCVGDLVTVLRLPQPTVSRHLSYLRRAGLVTARRDSSWMYYALAEARNPFHAKLLECLKSCFNEVPELTRDAARARKKPSCC
jgi:ArsR family transcriptional regulator